MTKHDESRVFLLIKYGIIDKNKLGWSAMEYIVELEQFNGPLDLLWHLIRESKVDIYTISMTEVTEKYLNYIKQFDVLELEKAGEYLYIASQLIEYKSRKLLPSDSLEDETEADFKNDLIARLLEYRKFNDVTDFFKEKEEARCLYYTSNGLNAEQYASVKEVRLVKQKQAPNLSAAYIRLLQRKFLHQPIQTHIYHETVTIESQVKYIENELKSKSKLKFSDVVKDKTRRYRVTLFLAMLQLCREHRIRIDQEETYGIIFIQGTGALNE